MLPRSRALRRARRRHGLSGGATPAGGRGRRLARAHGPHPRDRPRRASAIVVEPGVANLDVTRAVAAHGFFYAPDPSSQQVCTIGGNVAENSGGAHCLKYGFTTHHVTGLTLRPAGRRGRRARRQGARPGRPRPPRRDRRLRGHARRSSRGSRSASSARRRPCDAARGLPHDGRRGRRGLRDRRRRRDAVGDRDDGPAHDRGRRARGVAPGTRPGAGAVLLVELDGVVEQVEDDAAEIERICAECGAFEIRAATSDADRARLWKGRKSAFAAMGRVATDYYVQDGVVPRTRLPEVLRRIEELSRGARPPRRQRVPRGRRQPPPARPLRRERRRDGAGARARRGDPRRLPRRGRFADGRARRRHGQGVLDAADVLRARPPRLRAAPPRIRPARNLQPGQGDPDAAAVRRGARPVPDPRRSRGSALPSVSSLEQASAPSQRRTWRAAGSESATT